LIVTYTVHAGESLNSIWSWNAQEYGRDHADDYIAFLRYETGKLGADPFLGRPVRGRRDLRLLTIRRSPKAHGHVAAHQLEPAAVIVMDYFHTAQDIETRINRLR
jgi:plasmid stabilization system protein ParE